jgi:hypothetical protein
MGSFIFGTIFGIVVASVGFTGVAKMLDTGMEKVKEVAHDQVK